MALTFVTLNANGLQDANKRASLLQWISHLSASFVCLQETHVSSCSEAENWFVSYGFQVVTPPGSRHSCGTIVLYRPIFHLRNVWKDAEGRLVLCEFSYHDQVFRVCSVYAPNRNPDRYDFSILSVILWILQYLLYCVVTSMRCLIALSIVEVPAPLV